MLKDNREFIAHFAETDPKENQRLAESYRRHPFRFVAVVIADVFMDADIGQLWRSLDRHLAPDRNLRTDRQRVRDFLRRSESKAGGMESPGVVHFYRPGEGAKYIGGAQELQMPTGVERVGLLLFQFAPGMVMAASVAALEPELAASVFAAHHNSPVEKTRGYGLSFKFVETAKTRDLERRLREVADIDLLPARRGLLAGKRFPAGTLVVWTADNYPSDDDSTARDVTRVLGIETWGPWWEGDDRRLYPGIPGDPADPHGPGGNSLVIVQPPISDADKAQFGSQEASLRFNLELELHDWLPLLLLEEAALLLGDEAGRLRERLSRRASSRSRWLWSLWLGSLVGNLSDLQYRLGRLRQAVRMDGDRRGFQRFPMMVMRAEWRRPSPEQPRLGVAARIVGWLRNAAAEPKPPALPYNLRQAAFERLDRLTREGLEEVRLSFDRARLLSDIRSTNVLLLLTAVLAILTLISVIRASH
jgi:hypothetical protein